MDILDADEFSIEWCLNGGFAEPEEIESTFIPDRKSLLPKLPKFQPPRREINYGY